MSEEQTQSQIEADAAEAFGKAFRAEQLANYGCAGEIECTYKMDGNCHCFNRTLSRQMNMERSHNTKDRSDG